MMEFDAVLQKYSVTLEGVETIMLMGMDGLAVAFVTQDPDSAGAWEDFTAEYTSVIQSLNALIRKMDSHDIVEHIHRTGEKFILTYFLTPNYYLFAVLRAESLLGFARFQLRRMASELAADIASL